MNHEQPTPQVPDRSRHSSLATKLVQAAALAAALVPLGTVPVEAAPISMITCGFGGAGFSGTTPVLSGGNTTCQPSSPTVPGGQSFFNQAFYDWGAYTLTLEFLDINGPFHVAVLNEEISQNDMAARLVAFPGDICVPIADGGNTCVVFHFSSQNGGTTQSDNTWGLVNNVGWIATINWLADTNLGYPGNTVRVLHARGDDNTGNGQNVFDTDITVPNSYCPVDCSDDRGGDEGGDEGGDDVYLSLFPPGTDPEIAGLDNNFQSITVTSHVPEPSTYLLLGMGLMGLWYRRRPA